MTIPYKKEVIKYCDELSDCAKKLGAVNTIVRKQDGKLVGHNTDYFGFCSMLERTGLSVCGKKALVLGSGGASATAVAVLREKGALPVVISRSGENNYSNIHIHADAAVIVNTTPVGMYPDVGNTPLDLETFPRLEGVLDVIYNPARTKLLMQAERKGLVTENGLWMLVAQAKESAEWFSGKAISNDAIAQIHSNLRRKMENLVLIGMPGCGKSTVGSILAQKLTMQFADTDTQIVDRAGMPIPKIFDTVSEAGFRKIETEVLADFGKRSGLIIATGGGCVTRPENYQHLHRNSTIIWLKRNIECLPVDGRPLSAAGNLEKMYAVRRPLYDSFADMVIENSGTPEETADKIISKLLEV